MYVRTSWPLPKTSSDVPKVTYRNIVGCWIGSLHLCDVLYNFMLVEFGNVVQNWKEKLKGKYSKVKKNCHHVWYVFQNPNVKSSLLVNKFIFDNKCNKNMLMHIIIKNEHPLQSILSLLPSKQSQKAYLFTSLGIPWSWKGLKFLEYSPNNKEICKVSLRLIVYLKYGNVCQKFAKLPYQNILPFWIIN